MAELQTFQNAYLEATAANTVYSRNQQRWKFLLDSFTGGQAYREGAYLQRYSLETDKDYAARLNNTPLDNQCRSLVSLYTSFLFRQEPAREFGVLEDNPQIEAILEDADLDGRSIDAFMKDVAQWASVFGHCWIAVAKPNVGAITLADEQALGARPYLSLYNPLAVTDWRWSRQINGGYQLSYIKYLEEVNGTETVIKEWTADSITTYRVDTQEEKVLSVEVDINGLGYLPFVCAYAERSPVRGIGNSLIDDIADQQRMIYNELAEVYDSIRLDTHPSLVATAGTNANGASAGQVITMEENLDPNLKPYVLQFEGGQIDKIYNSINNRKKMIDSMGNVGAVRSTETTTMSGIAIETEFQLLNARLSSIADNLELAEEQIWQIVYTYMGYKWDGEIDYPGNFALHNIDNELDQLAKIKTLTTRPEVQQEVDYRIGEILDIEIIENEQDLMMNPPATLAEANAELMSEELIDGCPLPMVDKQLNIANHQTCIEQADLGPANPNARESVFWMKKAELWGVSETTARTQLCNNCAYYMNTKQIKDCFASAANQGTLPLATDVDPSWTNTNDAAAFCLKWDITCTAHRTCNTWAPGGPIVD